MGGHELAVEQRKAADLHPRDKPRERNLRGVSAAAEHAFAEKGAPKLHAVKAADQFAVVPNFDRMGMPCRVQGDHRMLDVVVDPGLIAVGAGGDHRKKVTVHRYGKSPRPDRPAQRP
ncbi:hypothetical protein GCM10023264_07380 [Sphingomonas daechungensis]